jgi:7,8-dihydro-6-hydroxymethylpterin-pyrophosphokinase
MINLKALLKKPIHKKTEKEIKLEKMRQVQKNLQNITKQTSYAYKSAVLRNKKKQEYMNYLTRAKAEVNPIKQHEIIRQYIEKK